jgi:hypothetical protein
MAYVKMKKHAKMWIHAKMKHKDVRTEAVEKVAWSSLGVQLIFHSCVRMEVVHSTR